MGQGDGTTEESLHAWLLACQGNISFPGAGQTQQEVAWASLSIFTLEGCFPGIVGTIVEKRLWH